MQDCHCDLQDFYRLFPLFFIGLHTSPPFSPRRGSCTIGVRSPKGARRRPRWRLRSPGRSARRPPPSFRAAAARTGRPAGLAPPRSRPRPRRPKPADRSRRRPGSRPAIYEGKPRGARIVAGGRRNARGAASRLPRRPGSLPRRIVTAPASSRRRSSQHSSLSLFEEADGSPGPRPNKIFPNVVQDPSCSGAGKSFASIGEFQAFSDVCGHLGNFS